MGLHKIEREDEKKWLSCQTQFGDSDFFQLPMLIFRHFHNFRIFLPSKSKTSKMSSSSFDKRIDDYIARSAEFAKPVLEDLRQVVHDACPKVQETIKWGFPHFDYHGSILCSMASFRQHCAFSFWLGAMMKDPAGLLEAVGTKTSMGHLGKITSANDLPAKKILAQYVKEAMSLIDKGETKKVVKSATAKKAAEAKVPDYFIAALKKNKMALAAFKKFSNSHRKDYVNWITEAKTEATRGKRMRMALEWLAEGKSRNWKYER
jgi:uncharacterized protein YdeI (YjbR/CyaY-like superfamily)